jgi:hypothetical protein
LFIQTSTSAANKEEEDRVQKEMLRQITLLKEREMDLEALCKQKGEEVKAIEALNSNMEFVLAERTAEVHLFRFSD